MTGLGCYFDPKRNFDIGFRHGVGKQHAFRGLSHITVKSDVLEKELRALKLPGIQFRRVSVPNAKNGQPGSGLYTEVIDYDAWRPTELSIWLMKLGVKFAAKNPFAPAPGRDTSGFVRHLGSTAFLNDLAAKGARVDVEAWLHQWREQAKIYQEQSKKFWIYR
jgi:uncharacterized protein YbbC (DUF1343 family)